MLPLESFARRKGGKFGRQAKCRQCDSERARVYLAKPGKRERRAETSAAWLVRNKNAVATRKAVSWKHSRAKHLCWEAKRRAERKGVPYDLTVADIAKLQRAIDEGRCELSGATLDLCGAEPARSPSLDRVTPCLGYVPSNVRVVCAALNFGMGDWGEEAFWALVETWAANRVGTLRGAGNASGATIAAEFIQAVMEAA